MAWSAPRTWVVSEVVTASVMNAHVRDNLKYLKGQAGDVTIEDRVNIPLTSGTNGKGLRIGDATNQYANFQGLDLSSNSYIFFSTNRQYDGSAWQQLNARAAGLVQITQDALTFATFPASSSVPTVRFKIDNAGNVGIGTVTPQGPLHAVGAGGGFMFLSLSGVNGTLQTPVVAGTVTYGVYGRAAIRSSQPATNASDFSAGGGALLAPGSSVALTVGADTITIAVTAGGAITVQRTAGSNTHVVNLFIMYA